MNQEQAAELVQSVKDLNASLRSIELVLSSIVTAINTK